MDRRECEQQYYPDHRTRRPPPQSVIPTYPTADELKLIQQQMEDLRRSCQLILDRMLDVTNPPVEMKLERHLLSVNNPHGVTASQVGAYTVAQCDGLMEAECRRAVAEESALSERVVAEVGRASSSEDAIREFQLQVAKLQQFSASHSLTEVKNAMNVMIAAARHEVAVVIPSVKISAEDL